MANAGTDRIAPERLLETLRPDLSAAASLWPWQRRALILAGVAVAAAVVTAPRVAGLAAALVLALPFFAVFFIRMLAVAHVLMTTLPRRGRSSTLLPQRLPSYAVLVPLYDEAAIIPDLVAALDGLHYPKSKLSIRFIVEEHDASTRAALDALHLPPHMDVVVAPDGQPRTKPRALDIALARTPGELVVVYDAEDQPEPDQLMKAAAAFEAAPPSVVCLQARLNVFNPTESLLARQFTLEYTALFDVMLPALERFGLPVPLGGTSNHFRRTALEAALGWDPHNVTEDADLGLRLRRLGLRVGILHSTTWEEAPARYRVWIGQRTRWLKGWMQTYLVHMRQPVRLYRELGGWAFLGFQLLMGSMIAAALVHPWFYGLIIAEGWSGTLFTQPGTLASSVVWWIAIVNLVLSYLTAIVAAGIGVVRRRRGRLAAHLVLLPVYWLLISWAAYRALAEFVRQPHHWQKTPHRARRRTHPVAAHTMPETGAR